MTRMTPQDLYDKYSNGFRGCLWEEAVYEYLLEKSKHPYFGEANYKIQYTGKGKLSLPFLSYLKFDKGAFSERQTDSDCVSHSIRNVCDVSRAVEIDVKKQKESWVARGATEIIYLQRGHSGAGMSCARGVDFVTRTGGVLVRKNYSGVVDLSKYNSRIGSNRDGRGASEKILKLAQKHQMKTASLIKNVDEAIDAIANGYAVSICSSYGFSNKRDKNGFCKRQGTWMHALSLIGIDDYSNHKGAVIANSWGAWCSGGDPEWGKLPIGCFMITYENLAGMIGQNGSYAISNFDGFPLQKLPDYGFDYLS
jgi:hypothetical protein